MTRTGVCSVRVSRSAAMPGLPASATAKRQMTSCRSSTMAPFPPKERPAAGSSPNSCGAPGRSSEPLRNLRPSMSRNVFLEPVSGECGPRQTTARSPTPFQKLAKPGPKREMPFAVKSMPQRHGTQPVRARARRVPHGGHRTHAGPRHRPRMERLARRRHALGAAHEARGERSRDRRGAGRDRHAHATIRHTRIRPANALATASIPGRPATVSPARQPPRGTARAGRCRTPLRGSNGGAAAPHAREHDMRPAAPIP